MTSRLRLVFVLLAMAVAVPTVTNAQPHASGGGCANQFGTEVCIAATGTAMPLTISANFFVNNFSSVDQLGSANLFICITGVGCSFEYATLTNTTGAYPVAFQPTGLGPGDARTEVDFFDRFGGFLFTGNSPQQFWIP